jgi:very-short-patch-repair endonuclease
LILRTVQAFPRGRTTEEILVLVGAGFSHEKRVAAVAELDGLLRGGFVEKTRGGRWQPRRTSVVRVAGAVAADVGANAGQGADVIVAAAASFSWNAVSGPLGDGQDNEVGTCDPIALLRYWRSALRADPRGATTQVADKHGIEWALISGRGPIVPAEGEILILTIALDALDPAFREALVRREGNDNALAVGWPMAVGRRGGVAVFQPVGLLAASWERRGGHLVVTIETDEILVNPDWVQGAARSSGWGGAALGDLLDMGNGSCLRASDLMLRLQDAVASQIRGRITGEDLASRLETTVQGIFESAAIFLPSDSSFTAGAARDLDEIATWPLERMARTALAPILGLSDVASSSDIHAVNIGALNAEQLRSVRYACAEPLTVVTGPPGTGKSQAIVSMAASVLLSGGSVVVASKNHQALDAVEDRLGALAPDVKFVTRTLKPEDDVDVGFADAVKHLVNRDHATRDAQVDDVLFVRLKEAANRRSEAIEATEKRSVLECQIADILERIEIRTRHGNGQEIATVPVFERVLLLDWLVALLARLFGRRVQQTGSVESEVLGAGATFKDLSERLGWLRAERDTVAGQDDPVALGDVVRDLAQTLLPSVMAQRTHLSEDRRQKIAQVYDNWTFAGGKSRLPNDLVLAVVDLRPLWLASILGTPRRIPLDDGLFDLVIFDEASQCDIATAMPLLARAKRAVVVGDDKQLSFIPQLGQARDRNLMQAQGLPVARMGRFAQSSRSLFDFASRVPGVARVTLRHQYRSAGPIVDYISESFYGGQLETSYDPNRLVVPLGAKPGLAWEDVPAPAVPQNGNVNTAEVSAVVRHLKVLLLEQDYLGSVGVITPFRAQVMALELAVREAIPETRLVAADLRVGTVDGFQGQERDIVLFSPCVGPRSPQSGLTFFQRDTRRLNVAISRARAVAMIFGDLDFARSGRSKALQRLAAKATEPPPRRGEGVFDSDWERKVYHALKARGLDPYPQHEISGRRLDFALFGKDGVKLDLEVDGRRWHQSADGRRKTSDLWRDHQLQSLGWRVRRFWVDELSKDMEGCIDIIERDLS